MHNGQALFLLVGTVLLIAIVVSTFTTLSTFQAETAATAALRATSVQALLDAQTREHQAFKDTLDRLVCVNQLPDDRKMDALSRGSDVCEYVSAIKRISRRP